MNSLKIEFIEKNDEYYINHKEVLNQLIYLLPKKLSFVVSN